MPKIIMRVQISGSRDGQDWPRPGEELEVSDAEALDLVRLGIATDPAAQIETAVDPSAVETATAPKAGHKAVNPRRAIVKGTKEES